MTKAKLYLIPVVIAEDTEHIIPEYAKSIVHTLDTFIVENERSARRYLRKIGYTKDFDSEVKLVLIDKHKSATNAIAKALSKGNDVGLLSEAGNAAIADPGDKVVDLAHKKRLEVVPLVGPSSIIMAMAASGLNGQSFSFNGYLPKEVPERIKTIKKLEAYSIKTGQSQIFMETPYRNDRMLVSLLANCKAQTRLCIATNVSGKNASIKTQTVLDWKKQRPEIHKQPTIFILQG